MEAHDEPTNLDSWLIGQFRDQPPPARLGELLLDDSAAAARIDELEALVDRLRAQIAPPRPVARGHVFFAPTPRGYTVVEVDGEPRSTRRYCSRVAATAWSAQAARRSRATGGSACISRPSRP